MIIPEVTTHLCPLCGGPLSTSIVSFVSDNVVAEVSYDCSKDGTVGYWAYGYWQPDMPFQG